MKAHRLLFGFLIFFTCYSIQAQVGVGNTTPQATLDISASNVTNPANDDGILIPRVGNFPAANPTAAQDGMLVFYTGTGFSGKGLYYWDNPTSNWIPVKGVERINDLIDGKTDPGTFSIYLGLGAGTDDNGSNNTNIGIGRNALNAIVNNDNNIAIGSATLQNYVGNTVPGNNVAIGNNTMTNMTTGALNTAVGQGAMENINFNTNSNVAVGTYALRNLASGTENTVLGYSAGNSSDGSYNVFLGRSSGNTIDGSRNVFIGYNSASTLATGSDLLYIENSNSLTPLIYGEFDNDILRINGELQVNNPGGTGYALPLIDGSANQIMATDGVGQISFVDASSLITVTDEIDWYEENTTNKPDAITDDIYTQGNVAIGKNTADYPLDIEVTTNTTNSIIARMVDNTNGTGDHIGLQQIMGGTHNEFVNALASYIDNTGSGLHTGIVTSVENGGGNQVGLRSTVRGNSGENTSILGSILNSGSASSYIQTGLGLDISQPSSQISYGIFNVLDASGANATGIKYGMYNLIDNGTGDHYGVYNDVRGTSNNNKYGTFNRFGIGTINTGGTLYGTYNDFGNSITSSNDKYGTYTQIPSTLSGTHYGSYVDVRNTSGYAGYFIGRLSLGMGLTNRYLMPETDGTTNQIMATDGAGQISFVDVSSLITVTDEIDWYEENTTNKPDAITDDIYTQGHVAIGKSTADYPLDIFENANGTLYGIAIDKSDNSAGETSGIFIEKTGSGTGRSHGVFTDINGAGTGQKYGIFNRITSSADGNQYGTRNFINGATSSFQFGVFNNLDNNGTANEYGVYNGMRTPSANNVYGVYNEFQEPTTANETTGTRNAFTNGTPGSDGMNGTYTSFDNSANGNYYGSRNIFLAGATGTGNKYGTFNDFANAAGGTHYGTYNNVNVSNGWAGYFLGRVYVGTTAANGYNLPTTDGANGQVMVTNGAGTLSFNTITGESTTASNGLNEVGNDVRLGGTLIQNTTVNQANNALNFNLNGNGDLNIQDAGVNKLTVLDNGDTVLGGDLYWRDENTAGMILAQMIDDGNDARFLLRENGNVSVDLDTNTQFIFNEQGLDRNFRIESNGSANMFFLDAGLNRMGINTNAPDGSVDIESNSTGTVAQLELTETAANDGARLNFNNSVETTNYWTLYGRADNTLTDNRFNLFHSSAGNVVVATGDGRVGIMRTPGTNTLEVNGNASKTTAGNWLANSDRRLKKNIQTIEGITALDKISQMRGVTYEWNDTKTGIDRPEDIQYGFIAQELMEVFPNKVTMDNNGYYQTAYGDYDALFVQAIKELKQKVQLLENENDQLKLQLQQFKDMDARLSALENKNDATTATTVAIKK